MRTGKCGGQTVPVVLHFLLLHMTIPCATLVKIYVPLKK